MKSLGDDDEEAENKSIRGHSDNQLIWFSWNNCWYINLWGSGLCSPELNWVIRWKAIKRAFEQTTEEVCAPRTRPSGEEHMDYIWDSPNDTLEPSPSTLAQVLL